MNFTITSPIFSQTDTCFTKEQVKEIGETIVNYMECQELLDNYQKEIVITESIVSSKNIQINLLNDKTLLCKKEIRKQRRLKVFYQMTTAVGGVLIVGLILK